MKLAHFVFILGLMIGAGSVYQVLSESLLGQQRVPAGDSLNPATEGKPSEDPQLQQIKQVQNLESLTNMIPSFDQVQWSEVLAVAKAAQEDPLAKVKAKNSHELEATWTNSVGRQLGGQIQGRPSKVGVGLSTD